MFNAEKRKELAMLLQEHFGINMLFHKETGYPTRYAAKAFRKLVKAMLVLDELVEGIAPDREQVFSLLAECFDRQPQIFIERAKKDHKTLSLEELITFLYGIKKPFLKKAKIVGCRHNDPYDPVYEYFTKAGSAAYKKLTDLVYGLEELLGEDVIESHEIVDALDSIVKDEL